MVFGFVASCVCGCLALLYDVSCFPECSVVGCVGVCVGSLFAMKVLSGFESDLLSVNSVANFVCGLLLVLTGYYLRFI